MRVSKGVYEELIAFAKEHDISGPVVPAKWFKNAFGSQIFCAVVQPCGNERR